MNNQTTVLLAYNETNPEMYVHKQDLVKEHLHFTPYFEIDNITPMEEFEAMAECIAGFGYKVITLNLNDNFFDLLEAIKKHKPDAIFNCVEIIYGVGRLEMTIAGLYELMEVPYTGAPPITLANCQNKVLAKMLLNAAGVNTPKYAVVQPGGKLPDDFALSLPVILKPLYEDASVGIENASVARSLGQIQERIDYITAEFNQPSLIEEFVEGRELNVAVFGDKHPVVLPVSEIDFSEMPAHLENIVSYQAKWDPSHESYHKTIPICPAHLTNEQLRIVEDFALKSFKTMGLRDYCRVDMRLNAKGEVFVLEVNPNPDLSEGAGFMRSAEAAGYSYGQMLNEIIKLALLRKKKTA